MLEIVKRETNRGPEPEPELGPVSGGIPFRGPLDGLAVVVMACLSDVVWVKGGGRVEKIIRVKCEKGGGYKTFW